MPWAYYYNSRKYFVPKMMEKVPKKRHCISQKVSSSR